MIDFEQAPASKIVAFGKSIVDEVLGLEGEERGFSGTVVSAAISAALFAIEEDLVDSPGSRNYRASEELMHMLLAFVDKHDIKEGEELND